VESVKRTGRLVIAHEAYERGGVAGEIAMQVTEQAFDYLDAPIVRVAGANVPVPYNVALERAAIPQEDDVVAAIRGLF
jgi:acetoin:2,6-dichlorophenolindophenol oxidoreductase subunit beta